MSNRKTVDVSSTKDKVNEMLKISTCSPDVRQGAINVLEDILHSTGNYRGFRYLNSAEVPTGQIPGINGACIDDGYDGDVVARFTNTDSTRAKYF